jgi:aryl-alcohol dehydrogenase-like predicted oxidoreductase
MVDCADRLGTAQVLRRLCPEPARLHDATRLCAPWSCWTGSAWPRQPLRGVKTNTLEIYEKGRRDCQQKRGLGARSYINAITEFERDHVHASHGAAKRLHPAKIAYGGAEGRDEERDAWEASIAAGVTLFDTAAMYAGGASERRLGEFSSDEALIATKFPATLWASADDMPGQLADSLARLRRDHVDVYQHHFPSRRVDIPRLMNHMADAVAAGQVRAVGVSNYSADQCARRRPPWRSAASHSRPTRWSTHCCTAGPRPTGCWMPAVSSASPSSPTSRLPVARSPADTPRPTGPAACGGSSSRSAAGVWRRLSRSTRCFGRSASVTAKTPAQVALRWLIENDTVLPIPGAKNRKQATQNAAALTFHLTQDEIEALDAATRALRLTPGA